MSASPKHATQTPKPTTLSIDVSTSRFASEIADALQQFTNPLPTAVSQFELRKPGIEQSQTWRVDAYFDAPPDISELRTHIQNAGVSSAPDLNLQPTPDLNWVALSQAGLKPVHAGRFTIHGSHDRDIAPFSPNAIEIDAGEAFGTAHHATTYLCLEAIDTLTRSRAFTRAIDLGCGSGVLAIALARSAPKCAIIATDIDKKAIDVTKDNARINRVASRVNALVATGLSHPALNRRGHFDLVIANILAGPLIELAGSIASVSKPGATIVLSGILTRQAREVSAAYRAAGCTLTRHARRDEWSALILKKA